MIHLPTSSPSSPQAFSCTGHILSRLSVVCVSSSSSTLQDTGLGDGTCPGESRKGRHSEGALALLTLGDQEQPGHE
ncbi:hypothetical protein P7K49_028590 [Saguinus oedipus]|uniref:Uncharacterized protein n=1 Tax=Saguinus oedipus TaxID=9490 RepID=A0ABQ9U6S2_SAGOE|nr:hypothetical protein P7K49_028590 [Saguinus oedipus]